MKITSIKQQEKLKSRYSIFVDEKYTFSLSESALLNQKIAVGQELTTQQVKDFKKLSVDDKMYNNTLRYAALRLRSRWELEDYLRRKKVDEPEADKILNKLSASGFIDDKAFAHAWVENRRLLKPISKRRLIQELKQKRINEEIINEVLEEDETDERTILHELIEKKERQSTYQNNQLKLMQYLARQGFNYEDIKKALTED